MTLVIGFNSSPHKDGNTAKLLGMALGAMAEKGVNTELVHVGGVPLSGCVDCGGCEEFPQCAITGDRVNEYIGMMRKADGILLGSPVYFGGMTSTMKAIIERAGVVMRNHGNFLGGKLGAAVVAARRTGALSTFDSINHFFLIGEMTIPGSNYWNNGMKEVEDDPKAADTMRFLGLKFAALLAAK